MCVVMTKTEKTQQPIYITYLSDEQLDRMNSAFGICFDNVDHQDGKGHSLTRRWRILMVVTIAVITMGLITMII